MSYRLLYSDLFHDECSDTMSAGLGVSLGIHHNHICIRSIGDPELVAVQ